MVKVGPGKAQRIAFDLTTNLAKFLQVIGNLLGHLRGCWLAPAELCEFRKTASGLIVHSSILSDFDRCSTVCVRLTLKCSRGQRDWRRFAQLPNRYHLPVTSLLHDFRDRIGVGGLRRINQQLLGPLLESKRIGGRSIPLIDSTDLLAATSAYKKIDWALLGPWGDFGGTHHQDRPEPLVCRLQTTL